MLIPLPIPPAEDGITLQECVQAWRAQPSVRGRQRDSLHCIHPTETGVAFVLKRFRHDSDLLGLLFMWMPLLISVKLLTQDTTDVSRTLTGDTGYTDDGVKAKP